ncbi:hypothetical protein K525DRAFT_267094 [Schizophyllum commune Loenen D]|nr:hypothetical protein K525DRAFT_267094 [Schizophyllum commune Loenen D]
MPPSSDTHKTEDLPSIISNGEVQPVRVPSVILKTPLPTATEDIPSPLTEISERASQVSQSSLQDTPCPPPRPSRHILPIKADVPIEPRTIFTQEPLAVVSPTHTIPSWLRDGGSLANAVGALEMEFKTVHLRSCELQATVQALNIEKEGLQAKVGLLERQATILRADIGSFSAMARELRAGLQRSEARVKELERVVQDLTTDKHSLVEDARKQNIDLQTWVTKAERLGKTLEQAQGARGRAEEARIQAIREKDFAVACKMRAEHDTSIARSAAQAAEERAELALDQTAKAEGRAAAADSRVAEALAEAASARNTAFEAEARIAAAEETVSVAIANERQARADAQMAAEDARSARHDRALMSIDLEQARDDAKTARKEACLLNEDAEYLMVALEETVEEMMTAQAEARQARHEAAVAKASASPALEEAKAARKEAEEAKQEAKSCKAKANALSASFAAVRAALPISPRASVDLHQLREPASVDRPIATAFLCPPVDSPNPLRSPSPDSQQSFISSVPPRIALSAGRAAKALVEDSLRAASQVPATPDSTAGDDPVLVEDPSVRLMPSLEAPTSLPSASITSNTSAARLTKNTSRTPASMPAPPFPKRISPSRTVTPAPPFPTRPKRLSPSRTFAPPPPFPKRVSPSQTSTPAPPFPRAPLTSASQRSGMINWHVVREQAPSPSPLVVVTAKSLKRCMGGKRKRGRGRDAELSSNRHDADANDGREPLQVAKRARLDE